MTTQNPSNILRLHPKLSAWRFCIMCYPLSFRQVEGILHEPEIDICPETVWFWVGQVVQNLLKKFERRGWTNIQIGNDI
jgi:transposase-like protein|tara:strand:+ start:962 stop:1198 length:237 start_codon:yes stop_codon:yes gene_type:complete